MATYTSNLNLKKPALDNDALITDINNNMDILDAAANGIQDALAIVATGNTHAAITSGQFVYVRNHSTLTEGLYVASSNIAANATLSSSNLTANSSGGLNTLNEQIGNLKDNFKYKMLSNYQTDPTWGFIDTGLSTANWILLAAYALGDSNSHMRISVLSGGGNYRLQSISFTDGSVDKTFSGNVWLFYVPRNMFKEFT